MELLGVILIFTIFSSTIAILYAFWRLLPQKRESARYVICKDSSDFDSYMEKILSIKKHVYQYTSSKRVGNTITIEGIEGNEIWAMITNPNEPIEYLIGQIMESEKAFENMDLSEIRELLIYTQNIQKRRKL